MHACIVHNNYLLEVHVHVHVHVVLITSRRATLKNAGRPGTRLEHKRSTLILLLKLLVTVVFLYSSATSISVGSVLQDLARRQTPPRA